MKAALDLQTVLGLIAAGEGQCVEFKQSFAEEKEAIESLCAFAHAQGGTLLFGICDDGRPIDLSIGKNTLEDFATKLRRCADPPLTVPVTRMLVAGKDVVCVSVDKARDGQVVFAFGKAYIRVGKTNQQMTENEIRNRYFAGFNAENLQANETLRSSRETESWDEREQRRCDGYATNRGLFLVHTWRPSKKQGQVADVVISIAQHGEGPQTCGTIKSVEYHLGPKFFDRTVVKSDPGNRFRLEVSAYSPMLCLARVNFDDGTPYLDLERYIDFWPSASAEYWAQEKTQNAIGRLLEVLSYIDTHKDLDQELPWGETVKSGIEGRIAESFWDLTKLLADAFSSDSWTVGDREVLMTQRKQGLRRLIKKYRARKSSK